MDWATKRRLIYLGGIGMVVAVILFAYLYPRLNKPPTCIDGKQNGTEAGIDCGGACEAACFFQANDIIVRWTKTFRVADGLYNAVAYAENQNASTGIKSTSYEFKLYDADNIFIARRTGRTFIGPNSRTPIFEAGINTGNRVPARAAFTFLEEPTWVQADARTDKLPIAVTDTRLADESSAPRLEATLNNDSIYGIQNTDIAAILYDKSGNAIAASKTLVERLDPHMSAPLFFTWSQAFGAPVERIEVIPRINVFAIDF